MNNKYTDTPTESVSHSATVNPWYEHAGQESAQPPLNPDRISRELSGYSTIAEARGNRHLEAFRAAKGLTAHALSTMGARVRRAVIAFPYVAGIAYRRMDTGRRWSTGRFKDHPLNVFYGFEPYARAILAESETDAAALIEHYRRADVAVMPLGARTWTPLWTAQLAVYPIVHVATDADEAGEQAFESIRDTGLSVVRHAPPEGFKDWCEVASRGEASDFLPYRGIMRTELLLKGGPRGGEAKKTLPIVQPRRP